MKRILLLTTATLLLAGIANATPIQWETATGGNGHWYDVIWLQPRALDWEVAKASAEGKGGYLATLTDQYENAFVWDLLTNTNRMADGTEYKNYWLGASDVEQEG